jgi:hypothetical protein
MSVIQLKGITQVTKAISEFGEKARKGLVSVLQDNATAIELAAIQAAPATLGGKSINLKQRINKISERNGLNWKVTVEGKDPLPVYIEFGTGASAKEILAPYDVDIKAIAREYYINGLGTLRGKPYLIPAWLKQEPILLKELEAELQRLADKV